MNRKAFLPFSAEQIRAAFTERRWDDLSRQLLEVLLHVQRRDYRSLDAAAGGEVQAFAALFLDLFASEEFAVPPQYQAQFVALNAVIANLVAMSGLGSTDAALERLRGQPEALGKLLALYSARNAVRLDRRAMFDARSDLATQWYFCFWENYKSCCAGEQSLRHLREHLAFEDERLGVTNNYVPLAYYGCTYADFENDRALKQRINLVFRRWVDALPPIVNRPDRRKVAVVTANWWPHQSVYRCTHGFVKALAGEFDLTLLHLGAEMRDDVDVSLFKEVRRFQMRKPMDLSALTPNDWSIAYYPDVGMNVESIFLSNVRLAPVQICGYGHPVSTFGSRIDYWLGGRDIESAEDHERNYSERLVLIPGPGVALGRPDYAPQGLHVPGEVLLVNCAWTAQKINHPLLVRLRRILDRSQRAIRYRFFTGNLFNNAFLALQRDLRDMLGEGNFEIRTGMPYAEYMTHVERGDFNLDSYPFGGYATALDAIVLGKPMLAWEGTKFYNRSAASVLRRVGLDELIARDGEAYEALALRLVHEDGYRRGLAARLASLDLEQALFGRDQAGSVVEAFRHLIERHEAYRGDGHRRPILVGA